MPVLYEDDRLSLEEGSATIITNVAIQFRPVFSCAIVLSYPPHHPTTSHNYHNYITGICAVGLHVGIAMTVSCDHGSAHDIEHQNQLGQL